MDVVVGVFLWLVCAVTVQGFVLSELQRSNWDPCSFAVRHAKSRYETDERQAWLRAYLGGPVVLLAQAMLGGFSWGWGLRTGWQPAGYGLTQHYFLDKWLTACVASDRAKFGLAVPRPGRCSECVDALRDLPQVAIKELLDA